MDIRQCCVRCRKADGPAGCGTVEFDYGKVRPSVGARVQQDLGFVALPVVRNDDEVGRIFDDVAVGEDFGRAYEKSGPGAKTFFVGFDEDKDGRLRTSYSEFGAL